MSRTRRLIVGLAGAAVAGVAAMSPLLAASPSPSAMADASAASSEPPSEPPPEAFELEAWLDGPVPADAAPGSTIHVGAFVWIRGAEEPVRGATFQVRLHPASGSAEPAFDYGHEDFAGHLVADLVVPEGGAGELEIGLPGTVCENDVCGPQLTPVPIRGVGPPPDVSLTALAQAVVDPPVAALVAGEPAAFDITVASRIAWPAPGLVLPESLWLQAREPQGPVVAEAEAELADAAAGRYRARVTFDEAGQYVVQVATGPEADEPDLFGSSVRPLTVDAAPAASLVPGGSSGAADDATPGLVLAALVATLVLGLAIFVLGRGRVRAG
jgi:hypothetical protein